MIVAMELKKKNFELKSKYYDISNVINVVFVSVVFWMIKHERIERNMVEIEI